MFHLILLYMLVKMFYLGEVIGYVGPKNVYGVANNPYKDSNR